MVQTWAYSNSVCRVHLKWVFSCPLLKNDSFFFLQHYDVTLDSTILFCIPLLIRIKNKCGFSHFLFNWLESIIIRNSIKHTKNICASFEGAMEMNKMENNGFDLESKVGFKKKNTSLRSYRCFSFRFSYYPDWKLAFLKSQSYKDKEKKNEVFVSLTTW